jgi:hypothetical protein
MGEMVVAGEIGEMGWHRGSGIVAVAMCQWQCVSGNVAVAKGGSGNVSVAKGGSGKSGRVAVAGWQWQWQGVAVAAVVAVVVAVWQFGGVEGVSWRRFCI